jgi:SPP1 family predicted phage head-tail adaptor
VSRQRHSPGELSERITIRRIVRTADGSGGFERTQQDVATVRAKVRPLYGGERMQNDRLEAHAGYLVVIRSRPDVREEDSLFWHQQQRSLNIRFVRRMAARNLYLELETDMGVAP